MTSPKTNPDKEALEGEILHMQHRTKKLKNPKERFEKMALQKEIANKEEQLRWLNGNINKIRHN